LGLAAGLKAAGVNILERVQMQSIWRKSVELLARCLKIKGSLLQSLGWRHHKWRRSKLPHALAIRFWFDQFRLGGRGMEIVYDDDALSSFIPRLPISRQIIPCSSTRFLYSAIELDVDALFDGHELFLGGIMEHIEEAGIHSGDSACVLPAMTISTEERN
jgi:carbamoyl-phosphate synthase large subunit